MRGDIVAVLGGQLDAVDDEAAEGELKLRELFEKEERLRGLGRNTQVYSIPLNANATTTGTWRATAKDSASVSLTSLDLGPLAEEL